MSNRIRKFHSFVKEVSLELKLVEVLLFPICGSFKAEDSEEKRKPDDVVKGFETEFNSSYSPCQRYVSNVNLECEY